MRDEIDYWNHDAGPRWAADADRLDAQLEPVGAATLAAAALGPGQRVLDVGCGAGWLTIAAARRVAPGGSALGLDVAEPLLAVARRRAGSQGDGRVRFERGDAASHDLRPGAFDRIVSRLGVMFFRDSVAAFRRLGAGLDEAGRLTFSCWGRFEDNPWMGVPRAAAARVVELPPSPDPTTDDEPGPFRFADPARTTDMLERAGFADVAVTPSVGEFLVGGAGDLEDAVGFSMRIGPPASATRDADAATRDRVRSALHDALAPYAGPDGVRMAYRALVVTARKRTG